MGQAFDQTGALLGEVQADTAREALSKLELAHKDAVEFRIKKFADETQKSSPAQRDRMLQFFTYVHLPEHLGKVSLPFCQLAEELCATLPNNPERTVALRKLLEAKDCAVRALLYQD